MSVGIARGVDSVLAHTSPLEPTPGANLNQKCPRQAACGSAARTARALRTRKAHAATKSLTLLPHMGAMQTRLVSPTLDLGCTSRSLRET